MDMKPKYPPFEIPNDELSLKYDKEGKIKKRELIVGSAKFRPWLIESGIIPDPRITFPKIKEMAVHEDDTFICAFAKAGTHWTWEIANMLNRGNSEYDKRSKLSMMLEFHYPEEFVNADRPRVFNTHLPLDCLPSQILEQRLKILLLQRNPKDCLVSLYNHMKNMLPPGVPCPSWADFFQSFIEEDDEFERMCQYLEDFQNLLVDRSDHILPLYYEDLKKDLGSEVKKIASFMNVPCSNEFAKDIAEKCDFKNMKKADKSKTNDYDADLNYLYRKGQVGDWKNWFTVAQNERMDLEIKEKMAKLQFTYTYTL